MNFSQVPQCGPCSSKGGTGKVGAETGESTNTIESFERLLCSVLVEPELFNGGQVGNSEYGSQGLVHLVSNQDFPGFKLAKGCGKAGTGSFTLKRSHKELSSGRFNQCQSVSS